MASTTVYFIAGFNYGKKHKKLLDMGKVYKKFPDATKYSIESFMEGNKDALAKKYFRYNIALEVAGIIN